MHLFKRAMVTDLRIGHETVSSCFGTTKIALEVVKLLMHIGISGFRKTDGFSFLGLILHPLQRLVSLLISGTSQLGHVSIPALPYLQLNISKPAHINFNSCDYAKS